MRTRFSVLLVLVTVLTFVPLGSATANENQPFPFVSPHTTVNVWDGCSDEIFVGDVFLEGLGHVVEDAAGHTHVWFDVSGIATWEFDDGTIGEAHWSVHQTINHGTWGGETISVNVRDVFFDGVRQPGGGGHLLIHHAWGWNQHIVLTLHCNQGR